MNKQTSSYNREFYQAVEQGANTSAEEVLPVVLQFVQPQSVVDVGCGTGGWLAAFQRRGVSHILGFDGPWVDINALQIPRERFERADLSQPIAARERFDLVVSLEVAEHLAPDSAETFVDSLTRLGSTVLFSAAIPYQGGTHHINERWQSYWVRLFEAKGFRCVDCLRPILWDNTRVDFCYVQNIFLAVEQSNIDRWPRLAEAARMRPEPPADLVHPRLFLQSTAFAKYPKELFHGVLGSIRDKWVVAARRREAKRLQATSRWPPK